MKLKAYLKPVILLALALGLLTVCVIKSHAAHSTLNEQNTSVVQSVDASI